jgi:citrate lyase subunit beta/citryl-CoA lyase
METVIATKADALILDLEASARTELKAEARRTVQSKRAWLATQTQRVFARINRRSRLYDFEDILAVVGPTWKGSRPRPCVPEDVDCVSMKLSEAEYSDGLPVSTTHVIPLLERMRTLQFRPNVTAHPITIRRRQ